MIYVKSCNDVLQLSPRAGVLEYPNDTVSIDQQWRDIKFFYKPKWYDFSLFRAFLGEEAEEVKEDNQLKI